MKTTLQIEGMSCEHCVRHVTQALEELAGVASVAVSLAEKKAIVEHEDSVTLEQMKGAIEEAGYEINS